MAVLSAPDLSGTMGIDNLAELISKADVETIPPQYLPQLLAAPSPDILTDPNESGIQSSPIIG